MFLFFLFFEGVPGVGHAVSFRVKLGWEFSISNTYGKLVVVINTCGKLVVAIRSVWTEKSRCGCFIANSGVVSNLHLSLHQLPSYRIHQLLSCTVSFFSWSHLYNDTWLLPILCHPFHKLILKDIITGASIKITHKMQEVGTKVLQKPSINHCLCQDSR